MIWSTPRTLEYFALFIENVRPPKCGLIPDCIHEIGGYTMAYNPLCADDVTWEDVIPYVRNLYIPNARLIMRVNPEATITPEPETTMYATPDQTPTQDQTKSPNKEDERLLAPSLFDAKTDSNSNLSSWKWATIGAGSAAVIFGAGMIGVLIRQHIRDKNLIQFEMIDDPALGHTLLD